MLTKRNNLKGFCLMLCVGVVSCVASSAQAADKQTKSAEQIGKVVRQFWVVLGEAEKVSGGVDNKRVKTLLDWPCIMQGITPVETGTSFAFNTEAAFDEATKNISVPKSQKSPLAGSTLSNVKVQLVTNNLANVTYKLHVPSHTSPANPKRAAYTLSMVTILKYRPAQKAWKIVYSTVPTHKTRKIVYSTIPK